MKALEKVVKAFTDSDLKEIVEIQNQPKNHSRKANNHTIKELGRSEEAWNTVEDKLGVEKTSTNARITADFLSAKEVTPNTPALANMGAHGGARQKQQFSHSINNCQRIL